jgi:uncharacterized protein (TIGR04255 family)
VVFVEANVAARKYKRAPIKEALCAFNFAPASEWNFTVPGKIHTAIKDEYDGEPRNIAIQTIIQPIDGTHAPNIGFQNEVRVQLPNRDGTKIVVLGADMVSVSVLEPYEGWESFKARIERVLSTYYSINPPRQVIRIGLRYINHISIPGSKANAGEYFNIVPELRYPEYLDNPAFQLSNFTHRSEYIANNRVKVIVTNAGIIAQPSDQPQYILDVDTIWDAEPIEEFDDVLRVADMLHTIEGGVFEGMITDKARSLFDAE